MSKVWFITGVSRGFGREWALAALERGDRVAGTARKLETLDDIVAAYPDTFLPLQLDVTDRAGDFAAVAEAAERFGRLDVVVNNAGYGHFGMIEELTEEEIRAQLETNVFGALWVTQAALPILREQGSGHIIQVSSIGGISAFPNLGAYHASKWALEGFSQSLAQEVDGFGIHVTLIEPGGFSTDWAGPSSVHSTKTPPTTRCGPRALGPVRPSSPASRRLRGRRSWPWSTPTSRPCGCCWGPHRCRSRPPTTSRDCRPGANGSRSRWPPRATDRARTGRTGCRRCGPGTRPSTVVPPRRRWRGQNESAGSPSAASARLRRVRTAARR